MRTAASMLLLDVLIRYSAVALLGLFALLALRDGRRTPTTFYAALFTISIAALLLSTAPSELKLPYAAFVIARIIDIPNIVFVWWLGRSMFEDGFKLGKLEWLVFILYSSLILALRMQDYNIDITIPIWLDPLLDIFTVALLAHLAFIALKGRADDLIEPRRRLRMFFVLSLALATLAAVIAENLFMETHNEALSIFRGAIALILVIWGLLWITKLHPEKLEFQPLQVIPDKPPAAMDPRDEALRRRLITAMDEQEIYLEPNLNIRTLAARLKTPEHRLRVLINQGLGYRNFSAFLNTYRLKAVKTAFADPQKTRIPILTIAMDAGYNSLAPFNRAFLATEGMTPSKFRQETLLKSDQN